MQHAEDKHINSMKKTSRWET